MAANQLVQFLEMFIVIVRDLITFAILGRVIISWMAVSGKSYRGGKFGRVLYDLTDPILAVARKIPHRIGMIDLSPIIVLFGVDLIARFLIIFLRNLL